MRRIRIPALDSDVFARSRPNPGHISESATRVGCRRSAASRGSDRAGAVDGRTQGVGRRDLGQGEGAVDPDALRGDEPQPRAIAERGLEGVVQRPRGEHPADRADVEHRLVGAHAADGGPSGPRELLRGTVRDLPRDGVARIRRPRDVPRERRDHPHAIVIGPHVMPQTGPSRVSDSWAHP